MTNSPLDDIAGKLRQRVDRLINTAEAKFQYIRDIQGDPIRDLRDTETLTRVVNADAKVIDELVRTVMMMGAVTAESLHLQAQLVETVRELAGDVFEVDHALDGVADRLVQLTQEVNERTLIIPDTPEGL